MTALILFWLALGAVAALFIIAAGLLRCPRCGRWHEDENCQD